MLATLVVAAAWLQIHYDQLLMVEDFAGSEVSDLLFIPRVVHMTNYCRIFFSHIAFQDAGWMDDMFFEHCFNCFKHRVASLLPPPRVICTSVQQHGVLYGRDVPTFAYVWFLRMFHGMAVGSQHPAKQLRRINCFIEHVLWEMQAVRRLVLSAFRRQASSPPRQAGRQT